MIRQQTTQNCETKNKLVAWTFCKVCHSTYPFDQLICVFCYNRAKEKPKENLLESAFAKSLEVRVGNEYPRNIKRLNIPYPVPGHLTCVNCMQTEKCFCEKFGNPYKNCSREDFDSCPCRQCCAKEKKFRGNLVES